MRQPAVTFVVLAACTASLLPGRPEAADQPATGVTVGPGARAEGWRCTALGAGAVARVVSATALGRGTHASGAHMIAIGRGAYLERIEGSPKLNFGNGCAIAGNTLWLGGMACLKLVDRTGDTYVHAKEDGGDDQAPSGDVSRNRKHPLKTALRIDTGYAAENATPMLLWDNRAGKLKRVMVGPPDSGGQGFLALVIEN